MQDKNVKIQGNLVRVHLSGSFLKFQAIYKVKKLYLQLLILSVIAFFWGLLGVVFVQFSGLYDIGIASISQGLARLADYLIRSNKVSVDADTIYNVIFWLSQILINIPLFVLQDFQKVYLVNPLLCGSLQRFWVCLLLHSGRGKLLLVC